MLLNGITNFLCLPANCERTFFKKIKTNIEIRRLYFLYICQQQPVLPDCAISPHSVALVWFGSITQQQEELLRPRAEFITAAAHPTPASTVTAPVGQFRAHAPHSIHASRLRIRACFAFMLNTSCGHTIRQTPQPIHFSSSNASVTTSFK